MGCGRLRGKVALITGSSRGIGKAIAIEFAREGADIIINYISNRDKAEELAEHIREKFGVRTFILPFNISDRCEVNMARNVVREDLTKIDILVNNAGINKPNDFDCISDEDWDNVLNINLRGTFIVSQSFASLMSYGGCIINISSVSGQYGGPRTTHYAVSKGGVITLTHNMAIFFSKRNIRVNCISPGLIESDMANAAKNLGVVDRILLGRLGSVDEIAKAAVFLASDDASYITGHTLNVNGGLILGA